MEIECIRHDTCPGSKPTLKPRHARKSPYDHYYPVYCPYCPDYQPDPGKISEHPDIIGLEERIGDLETISAERLERIEATFSEQINQQTKPHTFQPSKPKPKLAEGVEL